MTATREPRVAVPTDPADVAAIDRAFEIGRAVLADPTILNEIPNGATLVAIRAGDDEATIERELAGALRAARRGRNVYIRHLAPGEWSAPREDPNG